MISLHNLTFIEQKMKDDSIENKCNAKHLTSRCRCFHRQNSEAAWLTVTGFPLLVFYWFPGNLYHHLGPIEGLSVLRKDETPTSGQREKQRSLKKRQRVEEDVLRSLASSFFPLAPFGDTSLDDFSALLLAEHLCVFDCWTDKTRRLKKFFRCNW